MTSITLVLVGAAAILALLALFGVDPRGRLTAGAALLLAVALLLGRAV
jgi:hypothetical protein